MTKQKIIGILFMQADKTGLSMIEYLPAIIFQLKYNMFKEVGISAGMQKNIISTE